MPARRKRPWSGVRTTKRAQVSRIEVEHVIDEKHKVYHTKEIEYKRLPPEVKEVLMESPEEITRALRKVLAEEKPEEPKKKKPTHTFADIPFPHGSVHLNKKKDVDTLYKLWSKELKNSLNSIDSSIRNAENQLQALRARVKERAYGKGFFSMLLHPIDFFLGVVLHPIKAIKGSAIADRIRIAKLDSELKRLKARQEQWKKLYQEELRALEEAYKRYKENPTKENAKRFADLLREIIKRNAELQRVCTLEAFTEFSHWRSFKHGYFNRDAYKAMVRESRRLRRNPKYISGLFEAAFAAIEEKR